MVRFRHALSCAVLCALVAGCAAAQDVVDDGSNTIAPVATVGGVGALPPADTTVRASVVPQPTVIADAGGQLLGEFADGNRVLMLGDSILASTSSRYGNQMCEALVPLGWRVAVEAEPSRFVEFGNKVLDQALRDDVSGAEEWNAAVVFLGSNYRGDPLAYENELREIITRLAPRPTVLTTVTVYRPEWSEVNDVVVRLADEYDNVTLLDWTTIAAAPGMLSGDRLHPTESGREALAGGVAALLGPAPQTPGECLRSVFRDDSAVGNNAPAVLGPPSSTSDGSTSSGAGSTGSATSTPTTQMTTTTVKPATSSTTTTAPSTSTTTTVTTPTTPSTTTSSTTTSSTTTTVPDTGG